MPRSDTIAQLRADACIHDRCPTWQEDFPLRRALLFYADAPLPEAARKQLGARRAYLESRVTALREHRRRASEGATQKAIDVNVGMILERLAAAMKSPLIATLQAFRRILGVCPCCGEIFRLTDLMIAYRAKPSVTWLDRLEADEERQQRAEDKFAEDERQIRELAKERGRQALPGLLREAEPVFACRGYFAHDVKPLFDPVELHHLRRNERLVGRDPDRPLRWPGARLAGCGKTRVLMSGHGE